MNIAIELPTLEAIKWAVERKMGLAFVPRLAAKAEIERGQLRAIRVREMQLKRRLFVLHRRGGNLSRAARAFLEILLDRRT
jgi:DNA-binding transcriptional LysR family regulator